MSKNRGGHHAPKPERPAPDAWDDFHPPRVVTTGPALDEDRMPIFYVDDVEYTAPRRVPAYVATQAIEVAAMRGPEAAVWHMVTSALSEEAVEQLKTCKHMTYEDSQAIYSQLGRIYYGQMERMTGK